MKSPFPVTSLIEKILRHRFIKFGTVGFSGVLLNLAVLYLAQEVLFASIESVEMRLNLSLSLAIFLATINNFLWNRSWTWGDRQGELKKNFFLQMLHYFVACWLAILIQFLFTKMLAHLVHYLVANLISICLAALINFVLNDIWTFDRKGFRRILEALGILVFKSHPDA